MQRILHIIDSLGYNGRAKQLLVLSQKLREQGVDVHAAALGGRRALASDFTAAGVATSGLGRRWPIDTTAIFRLQRLISRLRPDVVHTWDCDAALHSCLAARMAGARYLVAGQHDIDPWTSSSKWFIHRSVAKCVSRFAVSSTHVREWCIKHGLPGEKITVISPGVPPAPTSDVSRDALLHELRLPADARLIGVVGRLVPEKRVKDLIWAADLLRVLHDNLRLLIIGTGPQCAQLEQYARLASDLDHIQFLGERPDVWRIMPHLDVLWNASENRSPSIAILEAMAAGVPVIASDTPINREHVVENETGYLIPLGTRSGRAARARHTDRIFTDPELAARLGAAGRQRVAANFNIERALADHLSLYRQLN